MSDLLDAFAEALQDLLEERALSIGAIDIVVEVNAPHVDGELLFGEGPDIGFSIDSTSRTCSFCELVGDESERWLDHRVEDLAVDAAPAGSAGDDARRELALAVLQGVLDARRPLRSRP
jgi:hypothetical protein